MGEKRGRESGSESRLGLARQLVGLGGPEPVQVLCGGAEWGQEILRHWDRQQASCAALQWVQSSWVYFNCFFEGWLH